MEVEMIKGFFLRYLLMPLIVLVMAMVMKQMRKKVPKIKAKVLIVYVLLGALLLALPGFLGFSGSQFSPLWYLLAMLYYGFLGVLHVNTLKRYFKEVQRSVAFIIAFELLITISCMLLGAYLFVLIFDWLSPFEGYAVMSATSMLVFLVPLAFYYAYVQFMNIPFNIYKTWQLDPYKKAFDFDGLDFNKLMVLNIELTKNIEDGNRFRVKAKTISSGLSFGDWFFKFVDDYNHKNPGTRIQMFNENEEPYTWIFYVKKSIFHFRKYIDFDEDVTVNKIIENDVIICKRVIQHEEEHNFTFRSQNIDE
ncbi:hypothetical protein DBR32_14200 [Taibaiella sp. KBW10]|uniref:TssN family type VI secretion system protein n=1 Tax=Taibaiella sp. KBW10 TaxID=2153357 RepID=UPI000F5B44EF|nr:TssN family type VI secretion system protein [Taibaiella sp. KBW10]RQO29734.1 hypothetical protein DBR32_14200 [Taibaiella sp. KBW10]